MSLYISDLFFIMICFLPLYCVVRVRWLRGHDSGRGPAREIVMALFVLFMLGLLTLTFQNGEEDLKSRTLAQAWERLENGDGVNFIPFRTIRNYLKHGYAARVNFIWVNIVGNIVMFVPWGLGLPLLWRKFQSAWKVTFMSLALPVFIEFCQLFVGRTVDVDDIILNFAGGVLGGLMYLILRNCFSKLDQLADSGGRCKAEADTGNARKDR